MSNTRSGTNTVNKRVCTALVPFGCAFLAWLAGFDFDHRGFGVAYGFAVSVFLTVMVYLYPGWERQ